MAYAAGLAGAAAGLVLYRRNDLGFAVAVWVLTFGVGALLMIAGFLLDGLTTLLARMTALESDVRVLVGRGGPGGIGPQRPLDRPPNPWHRDDP